jgi:hypothetical protein
MSAYKIQMPGNYPEENIQHTEQGERLKSRIQLPSPNIQRTHICSTALCTEFLHDIAQKLEKCSFYINSLMSLCMAWLSLHQFDETCQCSAALSVPNMAEICQEIWKL